MATAGSPMMFLYGPKTFLPLGSLLTSTYTFFAASRHASMISGGVPAVLASTWIEIAGRSLVLHLPEPDLVPEPTGLRARLEALARSLGIDEFRMVLPQGDAFAEDFESVLN